MGYCIGRVGLLKGKETMEAYKRFFGDRAHHMLGVKQAKSYATFVCLFGVFEGIPRALRGVDDQWNTVRRSPDPPLDSTLVGTDSGLDWTEGWRRLGLLTCRWRVR